MVGVSVLSAKLGRHFASPPKGWHDGGGTTPRIDFLFYNRVTPAVRKQGEGPFKRFMDHLLLVRGKKKPLLPATDLELMDWITRNCDDVKFGTVQSWLSGVKRCMVDLRVDTSAFDTPWFKAGLKGLKKVKGESPPRRALPLTLPLLVRLNRVVLREGGARFFKQLNLGAAFALGFACFLRCGEFTYGDFDPVFHLQRRDVTLTGKVPTLRIKYSKMDQTRKGRILPIPKSNIAGFKHVCPFHLLTRLFTLFPAPPDAPLFSFSRTRATFPAKDVIAEFRGSVTRAGVNGDADGRVWSGHSFRRGAATWAADVGLTDNAIMQLGRWSLASTRGGHQRYIDLTLPQRLRLAERLYPGSPVTAMQRTPAFAVEDDDTDDGLPYSTTSPLLA
jgi:integrase